MVALLARRSDQMRLLILSSAGFVFLLFLFTQRESTSLPAPWRKSTSASGSGDLPMVPVNHGLEDDEFELGGPGNYDSSSSSSSSSPSSVNPPTTPITPTSHIASTDEETTIPSTVSSSDPSVRVEAHTYGFTVFDKLYLRNGTFFVVTKDAGAFPPRGRILFKSEGVEGGVEVDATDQELRYISPQESKHLLGEFASVVKDVTVFVYDPWQFLPHFYHFWGEVVIGAWRVYSTLGLGTGGVDGLPTLSRWVMPFVESDAQWRDHAGLNAPLMRLAFPGCTMEQAGQWRDWKRAGNTVVFERAVVVNRVSAHRSPLGSIWPKMISSTMNLTVPTNFWEPIRATIARSLFGYVPRVGSDGRVVGPVPATSASPSTPKKPIVTYISRQTAGRRLIPADHEALVKALRELEEEGVCEVRIPVMERLSLGEQVGEVAGSTILLGVHGNGLTHQLWMPPSLRSAVIEMVMPPAYIFDYEILARNMGHKHYLVRNDTVLSFKPGDWYRDGIHVPPGFHGDFIPVYGQVVADLIRKRLTQPEEDVEA